MICLRFWEASRRSGFESMMKGWSWRGKPETVCRRSMKY